MVAPQIPGLEVWFQRASDVVRKLRYGDIDLGIVGGDMFYELADGDNDLIVVHEALNFGQCHLGLGLPMAGAWRAHSTGWDCICSVCELRHYVQGWFVMFVLMSHAAPRRLGVGLLA